MKELRALWLFGVIFALVAVLILQSLLGWSWDAWTIGFVAIAVVWILFQWWRRYPHG